MSAEAAPVSYDQNYATDPILETSLGETHRERDGVLVVGAGANTEHMIDALNRLGKKHPLHFSDIKQPNFEVSPDHLHLVNTPEGQQTFRALIGRRALRATYLSVIPELHMSMLKEHLGYAGDSLIAFTVIPKPAVLSPEDMLEVDLMKEAMEERRRQTNPEFDPEVTPILFVHEHYKEKGAWHELRERLGDATVHLGRLQNVTITIEEARTAEEEGRVAAFRDGGLKDLGPHVISLGLDVQSSINTTDRYEIPNCSRTSVERFRYENSELPENVETGFIVHGETTLTDKATNEAHELQFTWSGGKGLVDKKEAILTFEHPDTHEHTTIIVDLRANTLDVPESIKHLFPKTQFEDNGYGRVVEVGLNGGDPRDSFQSWEEARVVTKWQHVLARQIEASPLIHIKGSSLDELAAA